jgi:murein DD-endopeptidase MepM/ murein hydrolase activator NlpD
MKLKFFFSVFLINLITICSNSVSSQVAYPKNYFRNPLDIPISLAGSFGELRPNHFHSGIDIRTNSQENLPVYAVADGYVARIRVSANGFGNALYINHPNGYTSVYGHLNSYNPIIAAYLKKIQYAKESFEVDLFPQAHEMPVKKGDVVALSGNTGGSGGPHLHFEIRDTKTEVTINPYLFGYEIEDHVPPTIQLVKLYPLTNTSAINGQNLSTAFLVKGKAGKYSLSSSKPILLHGNVVMGIVTFDSQTSAMEKNGVYSIEIKMDGKRYYYHEMDKFGFNETRGINSHIDYEERMKSKSAIQKCCVAPNNPLSIYRNLVNKGILNFQDDKLHAIDYVVKDVAGNTSLLSFNVQSTTSLPSQFNACKKPSCQAIFHYGKENVFKTPEVEVTIPAYGLYDSLYFEYSKTPKINGTLSAVHHVHNKYTPVNSFDLAIKPEVLSDNLKGKALIVLVDDSGRKSSQGGSYKNGFVSTKLKNFGNYAVAIDTIPPSINPVNISDKKDLSKSHFIRFKITDNLSGVKSYRCTVDGKWILMELDGKSSNLTYTFDEHVQKGTHELKLVVADLKNNEKEFKCEFKR